MGHMWCPGSAQPLSMDFPPPVSGRGQGLGSPSVWTQPPPRGAPPWKGALPQARCLNPCCPQHCLLGWDIFPPKSEKSSAPRSLDLWSCVSSEAQHRKLPAASPSHLVWSGCPRTDMPWSRPGVCRAPGGGRGQGEQSQERLCRGPSSQPTAPPFRLFRSLPAAPPTREGDPDSTIQMGMRGERRVTIQALPTRVPPCTPVWSGPQACAPCEALRTGHLEEDGAAATSCNPSSPLGHPRREPCPASAAGALKLRPPRLGRWRDPGPCPSWGQSWGGDMFVNKAHPCL